MKIAQETLDRLGEKFLVQKNDMGVIVSERADLVERSKNQELDAAESSHWSSFRPSDIQETDLK